MMIVRETTKRNDKHLNQTAPTIVGGVVHLAAWEWSIIGTYKNWQYSNSCIG